MIFVKGSKVTKEAKNAIQTFLESVFTTAPWNEDLPDKPLKVIFIGQNNPDTPHIRVNKMGQREPWTMGDILDNNEILFLEYEMTFMLDVRSNFVDVKPLDEEEPNINLVNYKNQKRKKLSGDSDVLSNISDSLVEVFELPDWIRYLSELGLHNCCLKDERESYEGLDYQNPLKLTFNIYVYIS